MLGGLEFRRHGFHDCHEDHFGSAELATSVLDAGLGSSVAALVPGSRHCSEVGGVRSFMVLPETGKSCSVFVSCVRAKLCARCFGVPSPCAGSVSCCCSSSCCCSPRRGPGGVPVVSRWCPGGVPVVSRWVPGGVPVVSRWCPGGVPVVSTACDARSWKSVGKAIVSALPHTS